MTKRVLPAGEDLDAFMLENRDLAEKMETRVKRQYEDAEKAQLEILDTL